MLTEISRENMTGERDDLIEEQRELSFYSHNIPSISVKAYLERIMKYTKMEETTLVIVLIYIDKLCETSNFLLTDSNIHR
jgi:hypothetical protein